MGRLGATGGSSGQRLAPTSRDWAAPLLSFLGVFRLLRPDPIF